MFLHFSFYFVTLTLQRPRLQHAGLGDKELPASLLPCSSTWCLHRGLQDLCWHRRVSASCGLFLIVFYPLPDTVIGMLCAYTNDYANTVGPRNLPSTSHGVTPTLKSFIVLLVFWCTWVQFIVYNTLRRTNKWWKTLFYHFLDTGCVNTFILFEDFRKKHADIYQTYKDLTDMDS